VRQLEMGEIQLKNRIKGFLSFLLKLPPKKSFTARERKQHAKAHR